MEANGLAVYPYMSASGAETGGRGEWFLENKWEMAAHLQRSEKDSEQFLHVCLVLEEVMCSCPH